MRRVITVPVIQSPDHVVTVMPKPKVKALRVYTKRCRHIHLSGRRCTIRYGRNAFGDYADDCPLHTGDCADCDAMMRAFPIRKTTIQEIQR